MDEIVTRTEAIEKSQKWYFTGISCKNGHIARRGVLNRSCYECQKKRSTKYRNTHKKYFKGKWQEYYNENKVELSEYGIERYRMLRQENPDYLKKKDARNSKTYRLRNPELVKKRSREYAKNNKGIINAKNAKRRARKLKATPLWVDHDKIKEIYKECEVINKKTSEKHVVDHIIPLQGENVCGLHIFENLRIITEKENCEKHNKLFEELI